MGLRLMNNTTEGLLYWQLQKQNGTKYMDNDKYEALCDLMIEIEKQSLRMEQNYKKYCT